MNEGKGIPATKRELLLRLLERGKVMVHLDARREGVDVPQDFRDEADLRLNVSYRFQYGDLEVGDTELRATLSFAGRPYACTVPFEAVFAMMSYSTTESFLFPMDAPPEALASFAAVMAPLTEGRDVSALFNSGAEIPQTHNRGRRPKLRAIDGGAGLQEPQDTTEGDEGAASAARGATVEQALEAEGEKPEASGGRPTLLAVAPAPDFDTEEGASEPVTGWTETGEPDGQQDERPSSVKGPHGPETSKETDPSPVRRAHLRVVK